MARFIHTYIARAPLWKWKFARKWAAPRPFARAAPWFEGYGLAVAALAVLLPTALISLLTHWTASEVFPAHISKHFFSSHREEFLFSLKPLFYFLLYLSFQAADFLSLFPMTAARFLFYLTGACLAWLTFYNIKKESGASSASWSAGIALLLLLGSPIFLERGFRVRSDMLASLLALSALACALAGQSARALRPARAAPLSIALLALSLAATPKAIYFVIFMSAYLSGLFIRGRRQAPRGGKRASATPPTPAAPKDLRAAPAKALPDDAPWAASFPLSGKSAAALAASFAALFLVLGFALGDPFFLTALKEAGAFYMDSLREASLYPRPDLSHTGIFLSKNPHLALLALFKALFILRRLLGVWFKPVKPVKPVKSGRGERGRRLFDLSFLLLCAVFVIHPLKKPFFIMALAPFFLFFFFSDPLWIKFQKEKLSSRAKLLIFIGCALFALFNSLVKLRSVYYEGNGRQKQAIARLNRLAASFPDIKIYDPNAFLFKRKAFQRHSASWKGEDIAQRLTAEGIEISLGSPFPKRPAAPQAPPAQARPRSAPPRSARQAELASNRRLEEIKPGAAALVITDSAFVHIGHHIHYKLIIARRRALPSGPLSYAFAKALFKGRPFWHVFLDSSDKPLPPAACLEAGRPAAAGLLARRQGRRQQVRLPRQTAMAHKPPSHQTRTNADAERAVAARASIRGSWFAGAGGSSAPALRASALRAPAAGAAASKGFLLPYRLYTPQAFSKDALKAPPGAQAIAFTDLPLPPPLGCRVFLDTLLRYDVQPIPPWL